ncbi:MAG: PHP domain-containing protein [Bacillota bacterium]
MQDWHNHSIFSDGENTIAQLVENAQKWGLDQFAVSDHYHMIKDLEEYHSELSRHPISKSVEIYAPHIVQNKVDINWCNRKLDFVIIEEISNSISIEDIVSKFTVPIIVAHPNPRIIPRLIGFDISYEFNMSIPLPNRRTMYELVKNKMKVRVGSDIHDIDSEFSILLLKQANDVAVAINKGYVPDWYVRC